jgi:predicted transcriptional regulator
VCGAAGVLSPRSALLRLAPRSTWGRTVPLRYHLDMAMNLRLTDAESEALRKKAEQEGRSMQEVARVAIAQYVSERPQRLRAAIDRVRTEDSELLERLSR